MLRATATAVQIDEPASPPDLAPRKAERVALDAEVTLRRSGQNTYRVNVFDASPHGCRVEFVERPYAEERVWVRFDGLEALEALVCWTSGPVTGLRFSRPIYPAVFELLLRRLGG